MKNEDFMEDWLDSGVSANNKAFQSLLVDKYTMYSYGIHHPLAVRVAGGVMLLNKYSPSRTTSKHRNLLKRLADEKGIISIELIHDEMLNVNDKLNNNEALKIEDFFMSINQLFKEDKHDQLGSLEAILLARSVDGTVTSMLVELESEDKIAEEIASKITTSLNERVGV